MTKVHFKNILFFKILRYLLVISGIFFLICIVLAFTTLPFWGYHWLGTSKSENEWEPETIILLGGGGMPSESNLMRSWYVSQAYAGFPDCNILIAMPGNINDSTSTPVKIKNELIIRGIQPNKIRYEYSGTNTRSQAINCAELINQSSSILLVTSPENMRRSILCFRKAGFKKINALPAFENALESNLLFDDDKLGGNKLLVPDIGSHISLRYQFWNHLKYEILIAREAIAIMYYKLRGWI